MRLTLQEMVAGAIAEATEREKLAQSEEGGEEKKEEKKAPPFAASAEKKNGEKAEEKKEGEKEKESAGYKCASADTGTVEKVAQALDFINANMGLIEWEKVAVGEPHPSQPANAPAPKVGPGTGPASDLATNMDSPTGGTQSTNTGQAKQNQPPMSPPADDVGNKDGQTNPETALQTDMKHVPGGTGEQPQLEEPGNLKVDKVASVRQLWNKVKQAADAENPAQIKAGPEPLENPDGTAAEEKVPSQPAAMSKQEKMVASNDAAINYTKGQAKAEAARQMGEVLGEPAQKKSSDPVLHENLDATSQAGVKLSSVQAKAARSYLRKLAQAGEDENASPEEKAKAEKLKKALEAKKNGNGEEPKKEKEKESQGMPMTPPMTPQMGGGAGTAGLV